MRSLGSARSPYLASQVARALSPPPAAAPSVRDCVSAGRAVFDGTFVENEEFTPPLPRVPKLWGDTSDPFAEAERLRAAIADAAAAGEVCPPKCTTAARARADRISTASQVERARVLERELKQLMIENELRYEVRVARHSCACSFRPISRDSRLRA